MVALARPTLSWPGRPRRLEPEPTRRWRRDRNAVPITRLSTCLIRTAVSAASPVPRRIAR